MNNSTTVDVGEFLPAAIGWGDVVVAIITLIVGWGLSRLARKGVLALARRTRGLSETVAVIAARAAGYTVLLVAFGIALAILGANVQPLFAVILVIGVVFVLVMRGISDNFTSGVVIQARQTVKLGDEIQVKGPNGPLTGIVIELNARSVLMTTADGREVHVPNASLLDEVLVNHTSRGARRSEVQVRVQRGELPIDELLHVPEETSAGCDHVRSEASAHATVEGVSPNRMMIRLQFWRDPAQQVTARGENAELDALGVGGHHPRHAVQTDVGPTRAHRDQPVDFSGLVIRLEVEIQLVHHALVLEYGAEQHRRKRTFRGHKLQLPVHDDPPRHPATTARGFGIAARRRLLPTSVPCPAG